jgi:hypothetical protein
MEPFPPAINRSIQELEAAIRELTETDNRYDDNPAGMRGQTSGMKTVFLAAAGDHRLAADLAAALATDNASTVFGVARAIIDDLRQQLAAGNPTDTQAGAAASK